MPKFLSVIFFSALASGIIPNRKKLLWLEKPIKPISLKLSQLEKLGVIPTNKEFQAFDRFLVKLGKSRLYPSISLPAIGNIDSKSMDSPLVPSNHRLLCSRSGSPMYPIKSLSLNSLTRNFSGAMDRFLGHGC